MDVLSGTYPSSIEKKNCCTSIQGLARGAGGGVVVVVVVVVAVAVVFFVFLVVVVVVVVVVAVVVVVVVVVIVKLFFGVIVFWNRGLLRLVQVLQQTFFGKRFGT